MNVALPALVIFVLLLPGFIFRSRLKRVERSSLDYSPFGQVVTEAVLWTFVTHVAWILLASVGGHFRPEPFTLMRLLGSDPHGQSIAMQRIAGQYEWIALYFGSLLIASFLIPNGIRHIISNYRLDRTAGPLSPLLRFHQAPWYYLLTSADFARNDDPDFIVVSAVVVLAGSAYLYTGVLDEFLVDSDGKLDRLVLQEVMRKPLKTETSGEVPSPSLYSVHGAYFVLRYSEAITLNVEYVKLRRDV